MHNSIPLYFCEYPDNVNMKKNLALEISFLLEIKNFFLLSFPTFFFLLNKPDPM